MQDILSDLDYAPRLASKAKRWKACAFDYFVYIVLICLINYVLGVSTGDGHPGIYIQITDWADLLRYSGPWFLLFPGMEAFTKGQTLGKILFQLKLVRKDGSNINFGFSFLKHLFDLVDIFPFFGIVGVIVASNTKDQQRVGDLVANTIVIDVSK